MSEKWVELTSLRPKVLGTSDTINQLHRLVALNKVDPTVIKIAHHIRLMCPANKDYNCQAQKVFDWVKQNVVFVRHPHQVQKLDSIRAMIAEMADIKKAGGYHGTAWAVGDCPHHSMWVASLAGILGFPYAFMTVIADPTRPDEFSHVYAALYINGKWVAADSSTSSATLGWEPPLPKERFRVWAEPDIESTLTSGDLENVKHLYRQNGSMRGMGEEIPPGGSPRLSPTEYPPEFFKIIPEKREGMPEFEQPMPEFIDDWWPKEPAKGEGEEEFIPKYPKVVPQESPSSRIPPDQAMFEAKQRPWYRFPKPGVTSGNPYYETWPWQTQVELAEGPNGEMVRTVEPHHHAPHSGISRHQFNVPGHIPGAPAFIHDERLEDQTMQGLGALKLRELPVQVSARPVVAKHLADVTEQQEQVVDKMLSDAKKKGAPPGLVKALEHRKNFAAHERNLARKVLERENAFFDRFTRDAAAMGVPRAMQAFSAFARPSEMFGMGQEEAAGGFAAEAAPPPSVTTALAPTQASPSFLSQIAGVLTSVTAGFSTVTQQLTAAKTAATVQSTSATVKPPTVVGASRPIYESPVFIAGAAIVGGFVLYNVVKK